ncbi:Transcriptional regulator, contains XRE-family HTH domain [Lachnospiraceae bacterium XBB2008]|nr:Transcriptional regulator, contains XRE-family HTH domain [Lachnospiraceae bacterium XBB2008]
MSEIKLTVLLRHLRKSHGYSQEYVARQLHIERSTYSHYETGRITPTFNSLINLARLYAVPSGIMLSFITTYYSDDDELYDDRYDGTIKKADAVNSATADMYQSESSDTGCFFVEIDELPDYLVFSESCDQKGFRLHTKDRVILFYVRFIEEAHAEAILSLLKAMKRENSNIPK